VRIAETAKRKSRLEPAAALCDRVLILNRAGVCCAPERSRFRSPGLELLGASPPMGPPENPTGHRRKQVAAGRLRPARRRPRPRRCLLKGCEQNFRPWHAQQRYCSTSCRQAARAWSQWKARRKYRTTARGKQKRSWQSQRYRKRVKQHQSPERKAAAEAARVITTKFFRWLVQPARLL
jgi:hypothetical protein